MYKKIGFIVRRNTFGGPGGRENLGVGRCSIASRNWNLYLPQLPNRLQSLKVIILVQFFVSVTNNYGYGGMLITSLEFLVFSRTECRDKIVCKNKHFTQHIPGAAHVGSLQTPS